MSEKNTLPENLSIATTEAEPEQNMPAAVEIDDVEASGRDKELEMYRSLLKPPTEFRNGFTWTVVAGALFCGLLMMPGSIYLSLMTGGGINASWVTLIIFSEISRRALKVMNTQELVTLLHVAGAMAAGGPFADFIWRQYFISSDAVKDAGLYGQFPTWWAPLPGSAAILERNLFHPDWLMPFLLVIFLTIIGSVKSYTIGYFFFRLCSDVERLPFPFAPISAQGSMALSEAGERKTTWKWRVFSIGAIIGLVFAIIQIGIPLVTGALLAKPIQIIPLPFYDTTTLTESFLPATPTGVVIDLGLMIWGMIAPFWAVMGSLGGLVITFVMNPILYKTGVYTRWQPGMDTISTSFVNSIDFWSIFGIGVTLGIAVVSFYQMFRDLNRQVREQRAKQQNGRSEIARRENIWDDIPDGRGDFSPWLAAMLYLICAAIVVFVCHLLVPAFNVWFLMFFTFIFTPFMTYINTRLLAINGQHVAIPLLRESAFLLSGFKGVEIWLAPLPLGEDYAGSANSFRVTELTGTNFWTNVKVTLLIVPLSFVLSFMFWSFIWKSTQIPSENFPYAQKFWDLRAKQTVLGFSMTLDTGGAEPLFFQTLKPNVNGGGYKGGITVATCSFLFTVVAFTLLSVFNLPTMAIYGFIGGVGGMPHGFIFTILGSLLGKFYFQKRFGQTQFLQMVPVLAAGYGTGFGLIGLIGVALNLIMKAISASPF